MVRLWWELSSWLMNGQFTVSLHRGERKFWFLSLFEWGCWFHPGTLPSWPHLKLINSQRPHLVILLCWGLSLQHYWVVVRGGKDTNIQSTEISLLMYQVSISPSTPHSDVQHHTVWLLVVLKFLMFVSSTITSLRQDRFVFCSLLLQWLLLRHSGNNLLIEW